jgi:hypothetical protein
MNVIFLEWMKSDLALFDNLGIPESESRLGANINRYHSRLQHAVTVTFNYHEAVQCVCGLYRQSVYETMEDENVPESAAHVLTRKRLIKDGMEFVLLFI